MSAENITTAPETDPLRELLHGLTGEQWAQLTEDLIAKYEQQGFTRREAVVLAVATITRGVGL